MRQTGFADDAEGSYSVLARSGFFVRKTHLKKKNRARFVSVGTEKGPGTSTLDKYQGKHQGR
jgi:hypothetical protein